MKILHTSDWHLGRLLYGKKRTDEHKAFLQWLLETINKFQVDVLVVAGDIFDTNTPSNSAQSMYYHFLLNVQQTACRHVIIVAGNHDSPSFLDAPKTLLGALNVHVVGTAPSLPDEEIFFISDINGKLDAIVCAVPYLRDRDLRKGQENQNYEERQRQLAAAIEEHYNDVLQAALKHCPQNTALSKEAQLPLIATGHLFTNGAQTIEGDGVRDLYVGNLAHVTEKAFSSHFHYVALGHLHLPQKVGGLNHVRYSGSPIPMGFGEANQQKEVVVVEFSSAVETPSITSIPVPCFQRLEKIRGDIPSIESRIGVLREKSESVWLEIEYTGNSLAPDLRKRIDALVDQSRLEVLRVQNRLVLNRVLQQIETSEELSDLDEADVFKRCLDAHHVPEEERAELIELHNDVLRNVLEKDKRER